VHRGLADDPRNTDNAWVELNVTLFAVGPSDAEDVDALLEDNGAALGWFRLSSGIPFTPNVEVSERCVALLLHSASNARSWANWHGRRDVGQLSSCGQRDSLFSFSYGQ
jgi:hypothetical protein